MLFETSKKFNAVKLEKLYLFILKIKFYQNLRYLNFNFILKFKY